MSLSLKLATYVSVDSEEIYEPQTEVDSFEPKSPNDQLEILAQLSDLSLRALRRASMLVLVAIGSNGIAPTLRPRLQGPDIELVLLM